jgi:hypothetical protein
LQFAVVLALFVAAARARGNRAALALARWLRLRSC